MDKEYRKVVISIIIIVIIIAVISVVLIYKEKSKLSPLEQDIIAFLESENSRNSTEEDQAKISRAMWLLKENPEDVESLIS
ncbi:hypothetical protein KKA24_00485, partial [Patescibacteria group bacterium]|nr:hypothetical protein [Patescibacteria group bacterium]